MRRACMLILGVGLTFGCSAADDLGQGAVESDDPPRMPIGKADSTGSCTADGANQCGGKSSGTCWCDPTCATYGDCCSDIAACGGGWSVNDVSYLFPLPKPGEDKLLLSLDQKGPKGELLPKKHYDAHVKYLWEAFFREEGYAWSRIVALRIDPCAGDDCHAEIRLSAQPLSGDPGIANPMTSTIDAAIHLIYQSTKKDFASFVKALEKLKQAAGADYDGEPLGPHPAMAREGLSGPFATGLRAAILKHVGASTLAKWTVMVRGRNSTNWTFEQFEKSGTGYEPTPIPATNGGLKQGVNEIGLNGDTKTRDTIVAPVDDAIGYPKELWKSSEVDALSKSELEALLGRLASFEDPEKTSNLTLDCGSCHLSENARPYFEELTGTKTPKKFLTFTPPPGQNLERHDETNLSGQVLRAFGYMDKNVAISQRTINESARVAHYLSTGDF